MSPSVSAPPGPKPPTSQPTGTESHGAPPRLLLDNSPPPSPCANVAGSRIHSLLDVQSGFRDFARNDVTPVSLREVAGSRIHSCWTYGLDSATSRGMTLPPSPCAKSQGPESTVVGLYSLDSATSRGMTLPPSPCAKSQGPESTVCWTIQSGFRDFARNDVWLMGTRAPVAG